MFLFKAMGRSGSGGSVVDVKRVGYGEETADNDIPEKGQTTLVGS